MLKKLINFARIDLLITPVDPLLIKSGQVSVSGASMAFVQTHRFGKKATPFIPGSSLKGVIRSYAEKICRSLRDAAPVCLPYAKPTRNEPGEEHQASCGLMFEKFKQDRNKDTVPTFDVYRLSCAACRLFGSHGFVGRFAASDAYPKANSVPLVEVRDGVAIDRFTGGAAQGAKYDLEVLTRGEFETTLEIRNFERWQLGLVGLVLRDMEEGLVRIGFGKSRGLGRIKAAVTNFEITYYNRAVSTLAGLDALCSAEDRRAYGFFPELQGSALPLPQATTSGLRHSHNVTGVWKDVLTPGVEDLLSYLSAVNWPQALERYMTA